MKKSKYYIIIFISLLFFLKRDNVIFAYTDHVHNDTVKGVIDDNGENIGGGFDEIHLPIDGKFYYDRNGETYLFRADDHLHLRIDGYKLNNFWYHNPKGWWFGKDSEHFFKGWHYIKDTWYWFNKSGYANTHIGWEKLKNGKWVYSRGIYGYYSDVNRKINGVWYHFDTNAYAHKK